MYRILFVCHGNICRSVGAQYILQNLVNLRNIDHAYFIDSAATSSEEIGNPVYPPMKYALEKEMIPVGNHHARQLRNSDYEKYDLLIGMDEENIWNMKRMYSDDPENKIHLLTEYTGHPDVIIEDPWYTRRFSECVAQLEEGCVGLLEYLENQRKSGRN